jgi:hypothetical protein
MDRASSSIAIVLLGDAVTRTQGGNRSTNENKREIYS